MKTLVKSRLPSVVALLALLLMAVPVSAADDGKAREGAAQVESGAKQIGRGVEDTAKGGGKRGGGSATRWSGGPRPGGTRSRRQDGQRSPRRSRPGPRRETGPSRSAGA